MDDGQRDTGGTQYATIRPVGRQEDQDLVGPGVLDMANHLHQHGMVQLHPVRLPAGARDSVVDGVL